MLVWDDTTPPFFWNSLFILTMFACLEDSLKGNDYTVICFCYVTYACVVTPQTRRCDLRGSQVKEKFRKRPNLTQLKCNLKAATVLLRGF
ncbi:hypothetical protein RchiOBHm_Chr2g0155301 [Rosa chinensis]|uniref:Secreted protein n=1 Tax=Rosa chinensis TaxID=74649 RepID=A0A2P6S163_ROSCH|nr:hypothetical protein RchiOBHm_Chr2g0155301 [Rosa chinensis]